MIQIVGGRLKNKALRVPAGNQVRPTSNRVREAVFNMLHHLIDWREYTALDLYAGSGALGLEAFSRGVNEVHFVESGSKQLPVLKANLQACQTEDKPFHLHRGQARKWLAQLNFGCRKCLVFIDPPYAAGEYEPLLSTLAKHPCLAEESLLVVECPSQLGLPALPEFACLKSRSYGSTRVEIWCYIQRNQTTI